MAQGVHNYSGQGFSLKGDKGRFVLPPQFRNTIKESSAAKTLCLVKHDRWNCLTGFGLSRVNDFEELLDKELEVALKSGREFDRDLRAMQLYGFIEVPFDDSGRYVLPEHLAALANIDDQLFYQGGGAFFTLWSPAVLDGMGAGWEGPVATCRKLAADALAKGRKA